MGTGSLLDIISKSWEEHTILWILISTLIVGFITLLFKISEIQVRSWQLRRARRVALEKYYLPLLQYTYAAENSVLTVLKSETKYNELNEHVRLRILYFIGTFLGWCQIVSKETFTDYIEHGLTSSRVLGIFGIHYHNIFKGISSDHYFSGLEERFKSDDDTRIPALVATAIGDLMIKDYKTNSSGSLQVIGFREFASGYNNDPEFKKWFSYIENILSYNARSQTDIKWNRLVIFYTYLHVFSYFLEFINENLFSGIVSRIDKILRIHQEPYLILLDQICKSIDPMVKTRIQNELLMLGYAMAYR